MLKLEVLGISHRAAALLLALAFAPAAKAGITETKIPPDAVCKFDEIKSQLGDMRYRSGNGFGLSYYKDDTIKAVARSTNADGVPLNNQPALLEQVRLLARNVNEKTVLISYSGKREDANRRFCGWIAWNALVVSKAKPDGTAKSFTDRSFVEAKDAWTEDANGWSPRFLTAGEMDPAAKGNNLYAKALSWPSNHEQALRIYDKPGGRVIGGLQRNEVFNIIDTGTKGGEEFLLLAGTRNRVVGWISQNSQLLWPSRLAVHWAGTGRGVVYHTLKGLEAGEPPLAEEPDNVSGRLPRDRNVARFPVLGPRTTVGDGLPEYYEIAFTGRNASAGARAGEAHDWWREFLAKARHFLGLDVDSRPEVPLTGYAPTRAGGIEVFNYWAALDPESFASLQGGMDILCPKIVKAANEHAIQAAMSEMVRGGGGDPMQPGETFQKFFERVLYIPALRLNSGFMKHTPATLARSLAEGTREAAQEAQQKVCLFSMQLDKMRSDWKVLKQKWNPEKILYEATGEIRYTWLVKSDSGLSLYYIPLDYFP
jgi:hypothetical protein